jgi:hypothetical protein
VLKGYAELRENLGGAGACTRAAGIINDFINS